MKFNKWILGLSAAACVLAAAAVRAQVSPQDLSSLNEPTIAASSGTNLNNIILLTRECDLAYAGQFYTTNGTATVTVVGSFSIDTTNFGLMPFTLTGTAPSNSLAAVLGGTNIAAISVGTNWAHTALSGFAAVNFNATTNGSSTSSLFNAGVKVNRPTINTQTY